ncbi:MAG: ADP-ribosylglycohydrolase family protein [Candidatus Methanoperedens sp.]|nr:ADP-ribosylglycohydrolase family protein [Candidatus Methanoperedens sp.]MCZ7394944.1 ADP-ribosylglycohydrolase family protein [Candidatus Methanoperedens sp.]
MKLEELSKYTGCMLGAAMGDALGKQNEGQSREDILSRGYVTDYGTAQVGCPGWKLRAGQYTDDTEQMMVLAQSIIKCGGFNAWDFAARVAKWGEDALNDPARKSLIGPSSSRALERLNSGTSWKESGSDIPSCGSAMRAAPIGLFYDDIEEVEENAALSSIPTHRSKAAVAGAVAVAVGVRCALNGMERLEIAKQTSARAINYDMELGKRIELSCRLITQEPGEVFAKLGTSCLVYETVPSAFYCFLRHFESPENAIIEAVNAGGDTDSIACITGALCGALHGIGSFPKMWIKGLENKEAIEQLAYMIFKKSVISNNQLSKKK